MLSGAAMVLRDIRWCTRLCSGMMQSAGEHRSTLIELRDSLQTSVAG